MRHLQQWWRHIAMGQCVTLRDRRRQQTARDIQHAALTLVRKDGFDAVTTEAIAARAGISLRTFFNYFPNKQAALVGPPLHFEADALDRFVTARGALIDDFAVLIRAQVEANATRKESIRLIDAIIDQTPALAQAFESAMHQLSASIEAALGQRLGTEAGDAATHLLAQLFTCAASQAFRQWGHDPQMTPDQAVALMQAQLSGAVQQAVAG